MKRVIIESPYAGHIDQNLAYLAAAIRDCFNRGEAPFASHALYPQVLSEETERQLGIHAGFLWWEAAEKIIFYTDRGWSPGMKDALARAVARNKPFETRTLEEIRGPEQADRTPSASIRALAESLGIPEGLTSVLSDPGPSNSLASADVPRAGGAEEPAQRGFPRGDPTAW
jgi:hypothetical protein